MKSGRGELNAVYVSAGGDIAVLHLDVQSGALTPVQHVTIGGTVMPLAVSPGRRFLYAARRVDRIEVQSFAIDAASGHLTRLGTAPLPESMAYITTDRAGRFLFSASYGGHKIAVGPIDAHGVAQSAQQVIATDPHAHAIQADRTNRFVYATSLGGDHISSWRFDAASGMLTPNHPALTHTPPHSGPRHFVWNAAGDRLYVLCELDGSLRAFEHDAGRGTLHERQSLSMLPPGFTGKPSAADVQLAPDGRHLYASERTSSTLAVFEVDGASGELRLVAHVATETTPRSFAIDPSGRWLIAAGQDSQAIALYAIDAVDGTLTLHQRQPAGQSPNWVEIVALRRG